MALFISVPHSVLPKSLGKIIDGKWVSPHTHATKYMARRVTGDSQMYRLAARSYLNDLSVLATPSSPLNLDAAMLGIDRTDIDAINWNTSCGYSLRTWGMKTKWDLFEEQGGKYVLKDNVLQAIIAFENEVSTGNLPSIIVEYTIKDEVRPKEKFDNQKVRLFSNVDFIYNIVMRMYVLPLLNILLANPTVSECFGKLNAGSTEWTALAIYLSHDNAKGTRYYDADFSSFDSCHRMEHFREIGYVMFEFSKLCGYDDRSARMVYYLFFMLSNQTLKYKSDWSMKFYGMPSGVIVTLMLNSIQNSIMYRVAFGKVTNIPLRHFKKLVFLSLRNF